MVELINKKEFAAVALDENVKIFVIHITTLSAVLAIQVYPSCQAQVRLFVFDRALVQFTSKYLDYAYVFLIDLAIKQTEKSGRNEHTIKLVEGKQMSYNSILQPN